MTFKPDEIWVIDLAVPPQGLRRAGLFVVITRFQDVDSIRLLRPLWTDKDGQGRRRKQAVINSFCKACKLEDDLKAELQIEQRNFEQTKANRKDQWELANRLVAQREAAAAAAAANTPQPMDVDNT